MERLITIREQQQTSYVLEGLTLKESITFEGKTSCKDYTLREVSYQELLHLRLSGQPGLALKKDGKLFYTEFSKGKYLAVTNVGRHLCGHCANVCRHCKKVDDWTIQYHMGLGRSFKTAVYRSGRIEKYDFIPNAIETFNCKTDVYLILSCDNFR